MGQLQEIEAKVKEIGYQIIAVSADRPTKLRESADGQHLTYTLVSDSTMNGAKAFGIAYRLEPKMVEAYADYGIDLEGASGLGHHILPVPSVFIVGTDGVIRFEYVNPNYEMRLDPEVMLAAAKAAIKE